jgi:hypothetical protein
MKPWTYSSRCLLFYLFFWGGVLYISLLMYGDQKWISSRISSSTYWSPWESERISPIQTTR